MIELDQDDRALDAVIEDRSVIRPADPREIRLVEVRLDLVHPHLRVSVIHVADELAYDVEERRTLGGVQLAAGQSRIVEHQIVAEGLGDGVVARLVGFDDRACALRVRQ